MRIAEGVDMTGACDKNRLFLFILSASYSPDLLFNSAAAFACACVHECVCVRAFADLPCEQWHLYALLIANQWALWDVWDALKAPTRHILVRQHMHEH